MANDEQPMSDDNVRVISDPAEALAYLVEVITQRVRIFNAMEDQAGAEAFLESFPTAHGRDLAASIWRAERSKYRKDGSRRSQRKQH